MVHLAGEQSTNDPKFEDSNLAFAGTRRKFQKDKKV
jgi:hypothetical protein